VFCGLPCYLVALSSLLPDSTRACIDLAPCLRVIHITLLHSSSTCFSVAFILNVSMLFCSEFLKLVLVLTLMGLVHWLVAEFVHLVTIYIRTDMYVRIYVCCHSYSLGFSFDNCFDTIVVTVILWYFDASLYMLI
jgi:hypothetical protein